MKTGHKFNLNGWELYVNNPPLKKWAWNKNKSLILAD